MDDNEEVLVITQYNKPAIWKEWAMYIGALMLLVAYLLTQHVLPVAVLTGALMYWNYTLFVTLKEYVKFVNASEFNKLLTTLAKYENNEHKNGTFQDTDGLIKGEDSDQTEEL